MNCPACDSSTKAIKYEGISIDRCSKCFGNWLDRNEITEVIARTEKLFTKEEKTKAENLKGIDHDGGVKLACPKCHETMNKNQYLMTSGVILDHCPKQCGVWLDYGELEKVQILLEELDHAGGYHNRQLNSENKETRNCPIDGTGLEKHIYENQKLDMCTTCGGFWCDDGELTTIIEKRDLDFSSQRPGPQKLGSPERHHPPRQCVTCSAEMQRVNFSYSSGIITDRCPQGHGIWLDHNEIERIQIFAEFWEKEETFSKNQQLLANVAVQVNKNYDEAVRAGRATSPIGRFINFVSDRLKK